MSNELEKRILLINNSYPSAKYPNACGYIKTIANCLNCFGDTVDLLVLKRTTYNTKYRFFQYLYFSMKIILKSFKNYDVLYLNHYTQLFFPLFLKLLFYRGKIIIHWHGGDLVSQNLLNRATVRLIKRTLRSNIYFIAPSVYFKGIVSETLEVNSNRIFVSPSGGVNINLFSPSLLSDKDIINIGFPSGLSKSKGADLLSDLLKNIYTLEKKLNKRIVVHYIDYGLEAEYWHAILCKKINNVIVYEKMSNEKMSLFYSNIDICLMLSNRESLGLVSLEAMSCNIPVIAKDVCAMSEFIIPSLTGELIGANSNVNELQEALCRCVDNLSLYSPREYVVDNYSFDSVVKNYKEMFKIIFK
jgi:glycosyltransferase involved in cell wall biosynthesis